MAICFLTTAAFAKNPGLMAYEVQCPECAKLAVDYYYHVVTCGKSKEPSLDWITEFSKSKDAQHLNAMMVLNRDGYDAEIKKMGEERCKRHQ